MTNSPHKHDQVLGVKVSITTKREVLDFVTSSLKKKSKFFITTPNPEIVVKAQKDNELMRALNSADIALPDGSGLRFALRLPEVIKGREIFEELLVLGSEKKWRIYLLGGTKDTNRKSIAKAKKICGESRVSGSEGPLYDNELHFALESDKNKYKDILKYINQFRPDLLFVAFGAPKQEKWVYRNFDKLDIGGAIVVGGSFDYFVGKMTLPPAWLARAGLEWLWRLCAEPARFRRIANAVIVFPFLLLRNRLSAG